MPEVRGFRLGQTYDEIVRRFAGKTLTPFGVYSRKDEAGHLREHVSGLEFRIGGDAVEKERFKDIQSVYLEFLDDRLVSFEVRYDHSVRWPNDLEFTAAVANMLGLPTKGWRDRYEPRLDCEGFSVTTIASSFMPKLKISEPGISELISKRLREAEEKKRRAFKP